MAAVCINAQELKQYTQVGEFRLSGLSLLENQYKNQTALQVMMPSFSYQDQRKERLLDRRKMAWVPQNFKNGTIDVEVANDLVADAPAYARGFVGVAFRITGMSLVAHVRPQGSRFGFAVARTSTPIGASSAWTLWPLMAMTCRSRV
jgi:hypothetical protein